MVKILMGLAVAIAIAAGGFFGFGFYTQQRVASEVEAAFEQIRAAGGKASHGRVSFDLSTRTLTVADIVTETNAPTPVSVKIASFTALGVRQPDSAQFFADTIQATDIEVGLSMAARPSGRVTYRAPRIMVKDYSGPAGLQQPASSSIIDIYRSAVEQFMRISASSVTVPALTGTMNFEGAVPGGGAGDFTYSGVSMQGIKDGKIAVMKADGLVFTVNTQQSGKPQKMTGNLANIASYDLDAAGAAAVLDPQKATDNQYYRVYRQISAGPYTITSEPGMRMRIDGFTIDDVGVRPSRVQLPALLALIPAAGSAPTPAQARDIMEKAAGLYEGIRVGSAEMRGLSMETPQAPLTLAAVRLNLDNGKIGEFAFEALDTRSANGPVKVGRFALKSLDLAGLLRMSALFLDPAQMPSPDQALGMLTLLEGAELKGLVAPYDSAGKPVSIDAINLNWGQFVGPIPSRAHLSAKLTTPIDPANPMLEPLIAAGIDSAAIDLDLGAAWTETSRAFVLAPMSLELGGLLKAQARVALANVPRGVFSLDPVQAATLAAQIEAEAMEITLRDIGGVDLAVAQYARMQNLTPDAARREIVESIKDGNANLDPDALAIVGAVAGFVENPLGTLTLKFTPRAKVPAMQLIELLSTEPLVALEQFQVQASTGR
jgi:hypothetical protein